MRSPRRESGTSHAWRLDHADRTAYSTARRRARVPAAGCCRRGRRSAPRYWVRKPIAACFASRTYTPVGRPDSSIEAVNTVSTSSVARYATRCLAANRGMTNTAVTTSSANPTRKREDFPPMPPQGHLSAELRLAVANYMLSVT